jgi:curved DNA-binding protein CbpA
MLNQAFVILGIEPTDDERVIRSAFLRLARIYHPDRFVDMPDDVRAEAERRMKEATLAYESLRAVKPADEPPPPPIDDEELRRRALRYREAAEKKKAMDEYDRARWRNWEEAEKRARDKAKIEADIAARLEYEVNGFRVRPDPKASKAADPEAINADKNLPLVPQSGNQQ